MARLANWSSATKQKTNWSSVAKSVTTWLGDLTVLIQGYLLAESGDFITTESGDRIQTYI